jgi:hypothetical protein
MREFKIGQYVSYQRHKAEGRFVVIRLLPQPKGEPRYVIRSEENPPTSTRPRQANCAEPLAHDEMPKPPI